MLVSNLALSPQYFDDSFGSVGVNEIGKFGVEPLEQSVPTKPTVKTLDVNLHGALYSE